MKKATIFVIMGVTALLCAIPSISLGQSRERMYITGNQTTFAVLRYDSTYQHLRDTRYTTSGYALWDTIWPARYQFEGYDTTGRGVWNTNAYFGNKANVRVPVNTTKYDTIFRGTPYISNFRILDSNGQPKQYFRPGEYAYFMFTFNNQTAYTCSLYVDVKCDRSRSSPYDWEGSTTKWTVGPYSHSIEWGVSWHIPTNQAQGLYYGCYRGNARGGFAIGWTSVWQTRFSTGWWMSISGVEETHETTPKNVNKFAISPNPLSNSTLLTLNSKTGGKAKVAIYDVAGNLVTSFDMPTNHPTPWDGRKLPTGVYFLRATAGDFTATEKVVITR